MTSTIFFIAVLKIALNFVRILEFCIFLAILFSWFPGSARHPIVQFIRRIAEPMLRVARKIVPRTGMIDFSPILAFFALTLVEHILLSILQGLLG